MGTQVHYKGFVPSYYSMRDLNEDSNSSGWALFYGDKTVPNRQYCNGFPSRTTTDAYPGSDKDILKQKMLEHEAIFRNQVVELHRLYRIQRDMMDELRRKEMRKLRSSMEPSCSSSHLGSQVPSEDVRKWHITNFPLENSSYTRPSTSGTEIINSPFSSLKGDGVQPGQVQMQNGYSSKASDVLEARPSKVRKKLFDLHLPADDYIDTEEGGQLRDNEGSLHPSYPANGNYVVTQESGTKLFLGGGGDAKGDSRKDASTSNSCLRSSIRLADLNEPAQLDEVTDPVDFLGYGNNHKETRSINASAKSNPPFVALPWNSNCISPNKSLSNLYDRSRGKERDWLASAYETGNIKGSSASLPRGLEEDKIPAASHQAPVMINKAYQAPGAHLVHHIKDGIWKDRMGHSLDMSHRNGEQSNYTQVGPFVASKMSSPYPCASSSEFSSSWPHSVSPWEKPNGNSFTQRLSSLHTNSFFNSSAAVGKGSLSSQSQIGDYWHTNGSSGLRPGCAGELPIRSGFYHGSSSGTKESPIHIPSAAFDSLSHIKGDRFTSEHPSDNACENILKNSNNTDVKSAKGFNLNVLATSALSEETPRPDVEFGNEKRERQDPVTVSPWLKANGKPEGVNTRIGGTSANSGFVQAYSNPPFCQSDPSALEHHHMKITKEVSETRHVRKILGVPILDIPIASRNESSSLFSASATLRSSPERETIRHEMRSMVIDINVACDVSMVEPEEPAAVEQIVTDKVMETKPINIRNHFDLNSCITEDEEPVSAETDKATVKTILDIDLEAPPVMDIEQDNLPGEDNDKQREASSQLPDHKPEHTQEELLRTAAEAIVAISSSTHCTLIEETRSDPSDDPLESLRWFVDVVSSCAAELDSASAKEVACQNNMMVAHSAFKEIDYFEAMTLQLTETKEEDYMPKPFVPEFLTVEDAGASSLTNRPRRGNARRGRQRRDFQRDILPGLASLSRIEVTEDIQIFGGLMRATGHTWNSSLTRRNGTRNGGARGRRKKIVDTTPATPVLTTTTTSSPLMHQLNNIEASLEDKSLTGWGKTPRRPRRQRCPAGNPPAVLLT